MSTKIDIITDAYSLIRVSGLTVLASPEDQMLGLRRLEDMMSEFSGRNIGVSYNFEDNPNPNSVHNIDRKYWYAISANLAARLLSDFGMEPTRAIIAAQQAGYSFLSSDTAILRETQYPSRMPRGAGSTLRYNRYQRFYRPQARVPLDSTSITMNIDDVKDFVEHFDAFLSASENISSMVITADTGLTILSSSLLSPDVNYRIKAAGNSGEKSDEFLQVKIVVTSSTGRIETRLINFEIIDTN